MSISPRFQQRSVVHVSKMATQAAAALLDELMGRSRNVLPEERNQNVHWDSPEVRTGETYHDLNGGEKREFRGKMKRLR